MTSVPDEIEELLETAVVPAHLATTVDDRPHVKPVWYRYEDGIVEVLTAGRTLQNVTANPRVAVSVEKNAEGTSEWMTVLRGTVETIDDPERVRAATRRVYSRYVGPDVDEWDEMYRTQLAEATQTLLEIRVGSATGLY